MITPFTTPETDFGLLFYIEYDLKIVIGIKNPGNCRIITFGNPFFFAMRGFCANIQGISLAIIAFLT